METLDVHALGPSGSGKTVFMASLYSRLRIRRSDLAFYLKTDHDTSLDLNAVFNRIANPDESWPEASQDVQEWRFSVAVPSSGADFEPLRVSYLDYPGGVLTNPQAAADGRIRSLLDRLRSAHGLLVLLDGMAVNDLMAGRPTGQRYLDFDLTSSLEIAQQSRCPIHFLVTKWDLLEKAYSLGSIRDRLLDDENFNDLIAAKARDVGATIRLIPVSSVGSGFAELTPEGGMRKTGVRARPYNVEIPLVAVLPDFMQFAYQEVARREASLEDAPGGSSRIQALMSSPDASAKIGTYAAQILRRIAPTVGGRLLQHNPALAALIANDPETVAKALTGLADRLLKLRQEREGSGRAAFLDDLHRRRLAVHSEREAYEVLERQFTTILDEFELHHPDSVLSAGTRSFLQGAAG
ncbi:hypothetical protein SAMN05660350_00465 [Geodermatophilus obscurus]|uniref:Uncharacterized protein n=1 Tax=Geodermatophilus obscurus TaxID=1861 RepID=A0A1M7S3T2_9ACTN|nr:hypothetical protein [Geodermatophilus obscurus]SHN53148.1 hypothetical protein SAMN05660350_00465 [Geodermatophilus obscurus]